MKDYSNKMSVSLLKLEMLFSEDMVDANQVYLGKKINTASMHITTRSVVGYCDNQREYMILGLANGSQC